MADHEYRNGKSAAGVNNAPNQRFEMQVDGQLSVLEYTFKNHRLFLTHTEVPPAIQSQGLGTKLAHAALEYARQNDLTVVAICPFVKEESGALLHYNVSTEGPLPPARELRVIQPTSQTQGGRNANEHPRSAFGSVI